MQFGSALAAWSSRAPSLAGMQGGGCCRTLLARCCPQGQSSSRELGVPHSAPRSKQNTKLKGKKENKAAVRTWPRLHVSNGHLHIDAGLHAAW